ncbi:MAG: hypothetical protein JWM14_2480 [Chitinophagaceae bacterium]|nr:hypothetical protein [Chitinophagaceae bacterium]
MCVVDLSFVHALLAQAFACAFHVLAHLRGLVGYLQRCVYTLFPSKCSM